MSAWDHLLCEKCWRDRSPNRQPHRVSMAVERPCCVCELPTRSGIYFRAFPENMPCKGKSGIHAPNPTPKGCLMIRGKLISPVNLQLERPVFRVDQPEWMIMPLAEYHDARQTWFIAGALAGALVMAAVAILIFTWFSAVTK